MSHRRLLAIVLALGACTSPPVAIPDVDGRGLPDGWALRLPPEQEGWRDQLVMEVNAALERAAVTLQRWPVDLAAPGGLREIRVLTPIEAKQHYLRLQSDADPRVPRTFPASRLTIVPLPRADRLLHADATPDGPPKTWLHDLQHEAMHLACLDRPGLDSAPRWFLEGLAESVCGRADGRPPTWPRWDLADRWAAGTSEGLQRARAHRVVELMASDSATPWLGVDPPQPVGGEGEPHRALRGRHAGWWPEAGRYLLAPPAGALVSLDLLPRSVGRSVPVSPDGGPPDPQIASWFGDWPLRFRLTAGDSGRYPDAGLLIASEGAGGSGWLRIRITEEDKLGARAEGPDSGLEMIRLYGGTDRGDGRDVELSLRDGAVHVQSGEFHERFPLAEHGLAPPFVMRLYAFDTAVRIDFEAPEPNQP